MIRDILEIVKSVGAGSNMWGAKSTPTNQEPSRVWNTHGTVKAIQVLFRREGVADDDDGRRCRRQRR